MVRRRFRIARNAALYRKERKACIQCTKKRHNNATEGSATAQEVKVKVKGKGRVRVRGGEERRKTFAKKRRGTQRSHLTP